MKQNVVTKIYEKMTPKERAKMAFEALCIGDTETAAEITKTVPRYTYNSVDTDYRGDLQHYFDVASMWSIEYWRSYCKMLAAISIQSTTKDTEKDQLDSAIDLELFWEGRLIALGLVLQAIEKSHGLKINTVTHYAGANSIFGLDYDPKKLKSDALEYYEMTIQLYQSILDGEKPSNEVDEYFKA